MRTNCETMAHALASRSLPSSPPGASTHPTNRPPVITPTPATTFSSVSPPRILSRKAPTSTSSLSPAARPSLTVGRSKFHRWQEVSPASNEVPYPSYLLSASPAAVAVSGSMDGRMSFRDVLLTASQAPPPQGVSQGPHSTGEDRASGRGAPQTLVEARCSRC
jgi:hypothetical protein